MSKIKKHICMVLSCVLWICVFTIHANAQRVDNDNESNVYTNEGNYKVTCITGEENIREYQESLGETYDPKLIEVYRTEKIENQNEIVPYLGNDYYLKNKKVSTSTDLNKVLKQYNRPAGKITISDSVSISNSYTATGGITADILKVQLGYNVTKSTTFSIKWANTYSYAVTLKVYPIYEKTTGEIWEKDVFLMRK